LQYLGLLAEAVARRRRIAIAEMIVFIVNEVVKG